MSANSYVIASRGNRNGGKKNENGSFPHCQDPQIMCGNEQIILTPFPYYKPEIQWEQYVDILKDLGLYQYAEEFLKRPIFLCKCLIIEYPLTSPSGSANHVIVERNAYSLPQNKNAFTLEDVMQIVSDFYNGPFTKNEKDSLYTALQKLSPSTERFKVERFVEQMMEPPSSDIELPSGGWVHFVDSAILDELQYRISEIDPKPIYSGHKFTEYLAEDIDIPRWMGIKGLTLSGVGVMISPQPPSYITIGWA